MPLILLTHLEVPRKTARREHDATTGFHAKDLAFLVEHRAHGLTIFEHQFFDVRVEPRRYVTIFERKQEPAH
jgi:hypothetical protein